MTGVAEDGTPRMCNRGWLLASRRRIGRSADSCAAAVREPRIFDYDARAKIQIMHELWNVGRLLLLSVVFALGQGACGGSTEDESAQDAGTDGGGAQGGSGGKGGASGSTSGGSTSGGSAGSAGSAGTSGSGGTAGTGGTACGDIGGSCSPEGASCDPDPDCCGCTYVCRGGHWEAGLCPPCAAPPGCPESAPLNGAACDVCTQDPCVYDSCASTSTRQTATCDGGRWTVSSTSCAEPCGFTNASLPCATGQVCVIPGALGPQPTCQDNPCGSAPLSCQCAGSLCDVGYCESAVNDFVYCVCPNC
jgi:hypothetical protein